MDYHIDFDVEFRENPYKGQYIAIEGIDGSGKSTQAEALMKHLQKQGKTVVLTSEPRSDLVIGNLIRQVLQAKITLPSAALQYLYTADRVVNHETIVYPALQRGDTVISHRSFWSAVPYGVMDKGLSDYNEKNSQAILVAQGVLSMYHQFIKPDKTFYLSISVDTAMDRLSKMDKVKEIYEKREKLTAIVKGYELLTRQFPNEFIIIDAEKPVDEVTANVVDSIK